MHITKLAGAFAMMLALWVGSSAINAQAAEHTRADRDFVMKATQAGDAELAAARAQLSSRDATIRAYARRMIVDHTAANTELGQLAEQKGIPYSHANVSVSSQPGNPQGSTTTRATGGATSRAMSSRAYMQKEVRDHQAVIALFKGEAHNGTDRDIEVFVGNTLQTLQGHLKMAQDYLAGRHITMPPLAPPAENNMQPIKPSPKPG